MAADAANLSGERVKFGAVEQRLTDILSGGASLSQVPDTVRGQRERAGGCAGPGQGSRWVGYSGRVCVARQHFAEVTCFAALAGWPTG